MKKVCLVAVSILMTLLLSGCGKVQKLECVRKVEGVDINFNVGFKGKVIETIDFSYILDLSNLKKEEVDSISKQDFCQVVKESMADYKDAFINCKHEISNSKLIVSTDMDVDKIAKNALDKMTSPENAKVDLEKQGFSCNIKDAN